MQRSFDKINRIQPSGVGRAGWLGLVVGLAATLMVACAVPPPPMLPSTAVPTNTPLPTDTPTVTELEEPEEPEESATPLETPEPGEEGEAPMIVTNGLAQLVERATVQLSQELGIETDQVALVRVENVEWPDASLGCPQPGMMYAQVITPGYRITLEAQGREYTFHTSADPDGPVVHCD